ncbi:MAG: mechanosensitive ion channel family protein [Candidatus Manganitrophus sp.]|nr:mechanosensitive ion channel family protein [Candidatus Manganitrophus sp.]WDT80765.1 MAG: mechanosensitive ion channel family protein [Candidatus Manganitrophus sp.]
MRYRFVWTALLLLVLSGCAHPSWAEENRSAPAPSESDATATVERAPVMLDGEVLFEVRGVTAYPAKERAREIAKRIRAIAADPTISPASLRVVEGEESAEIVAGDRPVMRVFDADADVEGVPRRTYAEVIRSRVVKAIAAYREDRSPRLLMLHTAYALGATLGFVLLLVGLRWAFRKLDLIVERRLQLRIKTLEAHTHAVIQAGQVWNAIRALLKGLQFFLAAAAAFLYLHFVLGLYPWTRPLSRRLLEILLNPLRVMAEGLFDALPGLAFIAILILLVRFALKLIRFFFTGIDQGTINLASFDRDWALPTFKIIRLLIVIFAIMVAYPYIPGSESTAFKGLSIFLGFLVSLGSTSLISSLIAGYTMIYRRAYKVGDFIQVNDFTGEVTETPLIVTHLRTIKNEEVVVPNSVMVNTDILNYSTHARSRGVILHTTVGIGYETPWRQVEAILLRAAGRTPGLRKEPSPFVLIKTLGDFCVTYEINVYCDNPLKMDRLYSELHRNILDQFNEYGVQIMTPAYESDSESPKVVPKERWYSAPARPPQMSGADRLESGAA